MKLAGYIGYTFDRPITVKTLLAAIAELGVSTDEITRIADELTIPASYPSDSEDFIAEGENLVVIRRGVEAAGFEFHWDSDWLGLYRKVEVEVPSLGLPDSVGGATLHFSSPDDLVA